MKYISVPLDLEYRYSFIRRDGRITLSREAADPSAVFWRGKYYIFPSMSKGCYVSEDLSHWEFLSLKGLPFYDYAPDVCVHGEYLYLCASKRDAVCNFYRSKTFPEGEFEEIEGSFPFWDPNLFFDDDGKVYLFWGCSNLTPVYGVELDENTMRPKGEPAVLLEGRHRVIGYERLGEDHFFDPETSATLKMLKDKLSPMLKKPASELTKEDVMKTLPPEQQEVLKKILLDSPYMEGAWMTKYKGKYYLQYAAPGTEFNIYGDGVYVADSPLGPYTLAENAPYSYHPGGFITGAGHGSTFRGEGALWHTSTARISRTHFFERRLGLWKAGFDEDDELYCDQRFGDWVHAVEDAPFKAPRWMLLSYQKPCTVSSSPEDAKNITDENIRTLWQSAEQQGTVILDLEKVCTVHAVQLNFGDNFGSVSLPARGEEEMKAHGRYIDDEKFPLRWYLEYSEDGAQWQMWEDHRSAEDDRAHPLLVNEEGISLRYLRLTVTEMPYGQNACVSGIRVFGVSDCPAPAPANNVRLSLEEDGEGFFAEWQGNAVGYNVLWGHAPEKLYHCYQVLGTTTANVRALVKGRSCYVRIDAFGEGGVTEGETLCLVP
ncbi:MAG TPA: family 43 glycosylhydrolase [Candidatus Gallimonas intestinavium]|uniref:Family 43 glycosylhydrolase n=1 Tax=Candidatus Gallimonas intestinavium TaxID=2838603 RepID=A0A9D2K0T2_9FIRM|nr:family 43 glycosylhydrolase [Candidatus Gallimonas intestinavium]